MRTLIIATALTALATLLMLSLQSCTTRGTLSPNMFEAPLGRLGDHTRLCETRCDDMSHPGWATCRRKCLGDHWTGSPTVGFSPPPVWPPMTSRWVDRP